MAAFMGLPQHKTFDQDTYNPNAKGTHNETQPEVPQIDCNCISKVCAQHVEGSMGDVQYTHHTKDKCEARSYQKKEHSVDKPMHRLYHIYRSSHEGVISAPSVFSPQTPSLYMSISEMGCIQMRHFTSVLKSIVN